MKKIGEDYTKEQLGEGLCKYCEVTPCNSRGDTCEGSYCDEAYEAYLEAHSNDSAVVKDDSFKLELSIDSLRQNIITAVKAELKESILTQLRFEALQDIKETIQKTADDTVKSYIESVFDKHTVSVGGGYNRDVRELTIKEYAIEQIAEIIESTQVKGTLYRDTTFTEYFIDQCVTPRIKEQVNKHIKITQARIDDELKKVFETNINNVLSEVALGVLKTNASYTNFINTLGITKQLGE